MIDEATLKAIDDAARDVIEGDETQRFRPGATLTETGTRLYDLLKPNVLLLLTATVRNLRKQLADRDAQ